MNPGVVLILISKMNYDKFLPIARDVLGYSPAKAADSASVELPPLAHHIACAAAFKNSEATCFISDAYLSLFHVGFLIAAADYDMIGILEMACMPFTVTETLMNGVSAVIISGSLLQWRDAVKTACNPKTKLARGARAAYNSIYKALCDQGLKGMFNGLQVCKQPDHTFLLEGPK